MQSHELARKLQETADYLLARPDIVISSSSSFPHLLLGFSRDKKLFLDAVRTCVPGKKQVTQYDVSFIPEDTLLELYVDRSVVCRKVQDEKWECEPLLSQTEEASIET